MRQGDVWPDPVKTLNVMLRSGTVSWGVRGTNGGYVSRKVRFRFIVVWRLFAPS